MEFKRQNVYVLRPAMRPVNRQPRTQPSDEREAVVLRLRPRTKQNLQLLQLKFLDRKGREPDPSEVIEKLINDAAARNFDVPYPAR
jgi:hypothetical protein